MSVEEKAIEQLHTDASFVPGPRPGSDRVWLNSVDVVDRLIRDFSRDVLEQLGKRTDFMYWLDGECRRMNGLFLGLSPSDRYDTGPWNSPDQLGEYVLKALQINGETRLAVRDAFMVFASKLIKVAKEGGGEFSDFDKARLDALVGMLRSALLGLTGVA